MLMGLTGFQKLVTMFTVVAVVTLYVSAGGIIIRWFIRRGKSQSQSTRPWRRWGRRGILSLAAVGLVVLAYGYFIEPGWIEVTQIQLATAKLPPGARPVRIVQISDTHCIGSVCNEDRLVEIVAVAKPDVIVFTGDSANSNAGLDIFRRCIARLAQIAPVYGVRGNWDYYYPFDPLAGSALKELNGQAVPLRFGSSEILLAGAGVQNLDDLQETLRHADRGVFTVALFHYPGDFLAGADGGADLHLAGHTHGGQIALPGYGALITLAPDGKRFEAGGYPLGRSYLYVNRGLGMEGGFAPRIRLFARPEVTVVDIVPARGA